jgi:hypothetical protein
MAPPTVRGRMTPVVPGIRLVPRGLRPRGTNAAPPGASGARVTHDSERTGRPENAVARFAQGWSSRRRGVVVRRRELRPDCTGRYRPSARLAGPSSSRTFGSVAAFAPPPPVHKFSADDVDLAVQDVALVGRVLELLSGDVSCLCHKAVQEVLQLFVSRVADIRKRVHQKHADPAGPARHPTGASEFARRRRWQEPCS